MSSPSSLCRCHGGREVRKVESRRACKFYFQLCAISRNRRGILRSPHTIHAQRWLRDLFCIFSLLYATFSYLFIIISIGLSCVSVVCTPPPPSPPVLCSSTCCYCAWNRAEKLSPECWRGNEIQFDISFNSILCVKWKWILTKASHVSEL